MAEVRHALTILAVARFTECVSFYRAAFAWEVAVDTPVYVEFRVPGGQRIGIYERLSFAQNVGSVPQQAAEGVLSSTELYFYCEHLESAIARIRTAGARELSALAKRAWGDEAAYFADPEGNVLVLARPAV